MAVLAARKSSSPFRLVAAGLVTTLACMGSAPSAYAQPEITHFSLSQAETGTDPLKGLDLQQLEAEKQRLLSLKSSAEGAAALSILPGAGHFYAGQNTRGAWVLGGFAGTLLVSFLGSYLLSSLNSDIARTAAVIVNVAPPSAYWAWSMSDAYYQTSLQNLAIERQIQDISLKQKEYGYYSTLLHLHF